MLSVRAAVFAGTLMLVATAGAQEPPKADPATELQVCVGYATQVKASRDAHEVELARLRVEIARLTAELAKKAH